MLQNKDFNSAKQLLQKAIKINSNHANAYNNLGIVFAELKERQNAIKCFENAIKIQPKNAPAFNNLGTEYKNLGKFKKALNFTNLVGKIAEEEGHHPDISLGWGYCLVMIHTHAIKGLSINDFINLLPNK